MTAATVDAVTGRLDRAHAGGGAPSLNVGGQSSLAGFLTAHRDALNEGGMAWTDLMGQSSFELPLTGAGGGFDAERLPVGNGLAAAGTYEPGGRRSADRWRDTHRRDGRRGPSALRAGRRFRSVMARHRRRVRSRWG